MAIVNAVASGDYSNYAVTFGGVIPQPGDTVRANTFVININTDATEILFEINSSGYFQITQTEIVANGGSINLTDCDFLHNANTTNGIRISHSSGSLTFRDVIVNNVSTGGACIISSSGNTTIRNIAWNSGFTTYCVLYSGSGFLTVNSVLIPGASSTGVNSNAGALLFAGSGTGNVQNAYHGIGTTSGPANGIVYSGSGPLSVTNCYGGESAIVSGAADGVPLLCAGSGIVRVTNAIAGNLSSRPAIRNSSGSSIIYIENAIGNNFGPGGNNFQSVAYSGGNASIFSSVYVENLIFGPYGACPVSGAIFLNPVITNTVQFRLSPDGATKTLIDSSINNAVPAQADVRFGTVYQNGDRTGTLRVPLASQVMSGVPVDNTIGTAILDAESLLSVLQPNPAFILERSLDDDKPLTFSWPNSTDIITGEVSIDNAPYVPLQGNISFLRTEGTKHYFTISYDKDDRPNEEGTARYKLTSGARTIYATLRVVQPNIAGFGPYKLNCNAASDNVGVQGVLISIVGKSAKTITDEDGNGSINVDGGKSYTIRVTPPAGYQDIEDITINVGQSNYQLNIILEKLLIPDLGPELCVLQVFIKSQGTVDVDPIAGVNLTANLNDCYIIDNDILHLNTVQSAVTNEAGYAELILLRGQSYNLEISSPVSYYQEIIPITIPDEASATLSQVIE